MFENKFTDKLLSNSESSFGIFIGFPSTQMIEMAAYNGFDVVVIDNEHGMLSSENIEHMIIASENAGITPLVRVISSNPTDILKVMDRGAHGIHVPQVNTKAEAERVVKAVKYPPNGERGAAFSMRAAKYGSVPINDYLMHANQETLICIHIESRKAIENLEDILTVEGIDIVYIGPTDLSVSLGHGGNMDHPEVLKSINKIYEIAKEKEIKVGIHTKSNEGAKRRIEWGADYISLTVTSLINQAFKDYMISVKE